MKKTALIIGAGFGGLSAAAFLARDGYSVTVLEKHEQSGGRARVWRKNGFVFDMGPSWYLMPDVFEKYFAEFGKKPSDFYSLKRLDPSYRIFYGSQDHSDLSADLEKNKAYFESVEPGASAKLTEYLAKSEYQYNIAVNDFLYREYDSIFDFFNWRMLMEGRKLHVFEKLEAYTKRYFKNDRLRKKLEYSMVFLGGAPKNTPALYSLMSHVDFNLGVWYPMGGMGVVTQALEKLARDLGVEFKFETEVTKIVSENGNVSEVQTNKGNFKADVVVFNGDYHYAETALLAEKDQTYKQSYWDKRTVAPSGFIMFLGLNKKIKNLEHHTLFFDNDWQEHFDGIFEHPEWPEKPSYYVCAPSKTDPSVAPEGKEAVFILVPVAAGLEDSDELRETYAKKIITHLEGLVGESIEDAIDVKRIYSQRDFYADYFAFKGTALGLSHTLLQTAIFRPHHRSKKVQNLFYTGQYTHPGIGMPMTLISSQIVAEQIKKIYG